MEKFLPLVLVLAGCDGHEMEERPPLSDAAAACAWTWSASGKDWRRCAITMTCGGHKYSATLTNCEQNLCDIECKYNSKETTGQISGRGSNKLSPCKSPWLVRDISDACGWTDAGYPPPFDLDINKQWAECSKDPKNHPMCPPGFPPR